MDKRTKALMAFLDASHSVYHAAAYLADTLENAGYTRVLEGEKWSLVPGGKYYLTRGGTAVMAFRVPQGRPMGFLMSEWDEKLLKYGELFETKLMDLGVNIPLEDALDLGWEILAECFEPNETGLKTSLLKERWPNKDGLM